MKGSHKRKKNSKKTVRKRKYKGGNKYTAVIVEPRKHKALEYVLTNFLENLDNSWDILILHGNLNKEYIENIINTSLKKYRNRISLQSLNKDNITIDEYNVILTSKDFYNKIPTETFLIFQTDTLINPRNKDNINKFLNYDYVGAPWCMNREAGEVGNGGLSLRKKSKMLEILHNTNYNLKTPENIFLSVNASKKISIKKPSKEEAELFSSETIWNPKSFGVHAPWKYTYITNLDIILKDFPELEKLIQLQNIETNIGGNLPFNVALLYFGMPRTLNIVYKTHINNIYDVFKKNNINYDIYFHTWKTDKNKIWNKNVNIPINYNSYKLIDPKYYKIEDQSNFLNTINFDDYFYKNVYNKKGNSSDGKWIPDLIRNHLCALESQKRVTKMMYNSGKKYEYVIYLRPDYSIDNLFDINIFNKIKDKTIILPKYDSNEGYNDRFAIMKYDMAKFYGNRIDEIIEFRKNHGRIVSEKYLKYIIDKYFDDIQFEDIKLTIVRP